MTTLKYNEDFNLIVSIDKRDSERVENRLTLNSYKFTTDVNKNAPNLITFSIQVSGLQKFNKLNDIIHS